MMWEIGKKHVIDLYQTNLGFKIYKKQIDDINRFYVHILFWAFILTRYDDEACWK